ncbi:hypothetical protein OESDEN_01816 [Oesophagostomum dentatum]|uniref:Uncharacterized protein n=1 Tax=Oesophagostomum dentatum TaxID=61180 RepID=A0A0B1TQW5_OESDE|nr:hypothetical protein OESDEN_01816 [Oesophagostomum dentatum]
MVVICNFDYHYNKSHLGLGLAIIFASAVCSLRFIQNSYINFLHIRFLISEPEVLYSCRAQNADGRFRFYNCTSEYDTQWCKSNNFSKYYGGGCFNSSSLDRPTAVIGSVQRYYQYVALLRRPQKVFFLFT